MSDAEETAKISHQQDLDDLKKKDPEFYEFLKEEESGLLRFDGEDVSLDDWSSDDDDEEEKDADVMSDSEIESSGDEADEIVDKETEDVTDQKKKKKQPEKLTEDKVMLLKNSLMQKQPSLTSIRNVIAAFRCAVANIDSAKKQEDDKDAKKKKKKTFAKKKHILLDSKYSVTEASVFNAVVGVCIQSLPSALGSYLNYHPSEMKKTKKKKIPLPSKQPMWPSIKLNVQTYLKEATNFLELLMDASVKRVFLRHLMVMAQYFIVFPRLTKGILKTLISLWSTDDNESIRVLSFFFIMRIVKLDQVRYLEKTLQRSYLSYVSNCKFTSPRLLPMINFMQQTYTELCSIDSVTTYNFAFLYIRQLAIHLRAAVTNRKKETLHIVYNWQFIHSIGLWTRVLSVLYPNHTLQPLIYPLIQVALGSIDLVPLKRYYPLRYRVLENLVQLGDATNTFIPLVTQITAPLKTKDMLKRPVPRNQKQRVYLDTMLKFSNSQMNDQNARDEVLDKIFDVLMMYFNSQAHTISFPEMTSPAVLILRKFIKETKNINHSKIIKNIIGWVEENGNFIKEKRAQVNFEVTDVDAVVAWERSNHEEGAPFFHHYNEYRAKRERELVNEIAERDRAVEERIPTVDREKFRSKFKQQDKREFSELFEEDDVENIEESFKKIVEGGGIRRSKSTGASIKPDVNDDVSTDDVTRKHSKAIPAKKAKRSKLKISGKKDIVKELRLSDLE